MTDPSGISAAFSPLGDHRKLAITSNGNTQNRVWDWDQGEIVVEGSAGLVATADLVVAIDGRLHEVNGRIITGGDCCGDAAAEIVLSLWRRHGAVAVDLVVGDFAVIVFDRGTGRICAAREITGRRTLFAARGAHGTQVHSSWQRLARNFLVAPEPDPLWVACYLGGIVLDASRTPYKPIRAVLPGHCMTWVQGSARQVRVAHWRPTRVARSASGVHDDVQQRLLEAVRCRLEGVSVAAVALSGGLDSALMLALCRAARPDLDLHAVCLAFRDEGDEQRQQALIARTVGARVTWVDPYAYGPFGRRGSRVTFARDLMPWAPSNWFLSEAMADGAAAVGAEALLTGEDADSSFGGYGLASLSDDLVRGRWWRWWREASLVRSSADISYRQLLDFSLWNAMPARLRRWSTARTTEPAVPLLAQSLARQLHLTDRLREAQSVPGARPGRLHRAAQLYAGRPEHVTEVSPGLGWLTSLAGTVLAEPYLDRRVMSYAMGLPPQHVRARGVTKVALRHLAAGLLDEEVSFVGPKPVLSGPNRHAVRTWQRKDVVEGLSLAEGNQTWFTGPEVASLRARFEAGSEDDEVPAVRLARLALWLEYVNSEKSP